MQWQIAVNSSNPKWKSALCRGDTKNQVLSNMQNWQYSSPDKDTPLWHLCECRTAIYWTSVPSETHCAFITVLTQTNDFLWGMPSVQQFPQKRKKQTKNTSVLLMNSTWSRDLVQKKQHQRQPRTPWSREWLPCFIDQASCRRSLKLRWGNQVNQVNTLPELLIRCWQTNTC